MIKLDKNDKPRKYYCKESFAIGDRKEVDLSVSGDSSTCDKFQYSFDKHELIFYQAPVEYPPVFTVKVMNSERWQLEINAIHFSDGRACNHDGGFFLALGKKTKLLAPLTGVLEPVDGVNEFLITSNSETIKLNVPTETVQAGNEWVLIIGEDLHKSVHIDIKKDEDRTVGFYNIPSLLTPKPKREPAKKKPGFFSCCGGNPSSSTPTSENTVLAEISIKSTAQGNAPR